MRHSSLATLFLAVTSSAAWSQSITTVAGNGSQGYNGENIPALAARLNLPIGVAVATDGTIYYVDSLNRRVRKVDPISGLISTVAGTGQQGYNGDNIPATTAMLNTPVAIALDQHGDLIIGDGGNWRIRKVDLFTGMISTIAGDGALGFNGNDIPATTAHLNNSSILVTVPGRGIVFSDYGNHCVRAIDSNGMIRGIAGVCGVSGYAGDGGPAKLALMENPSGIAVAPRGALDIVDQRGTCVRRVSLYPPMFIRTVVGVCGSYGSGPDGVPGASASFAQLEGIAEDAKWNIYLPEEDASKIRRIDRVTGLVSTIAGTGLPGYNGDGIPAVTAQLDTPSFITYDRVRNALVFSDSNNHRVRRIALSGITDDCTAALDVDGDGIANPADNCPSLYNPSQTVAAVGNTRGIVCDDSSDMDGDGIPEVTDNCPNEGGALELGVNAPAFELTANSAQLDGNNDKIGDQCTSCRYCFFGQSSGATYSWGIDADNDGMIGAAPDAIDFNAPGVSPGAPASTLASAFAQRIEQQSSFNAVASGNCVDLFTTSGLWVGPVANPSCLVNASGCSFNPTIYSGYGPDCSIEDDAVWSVPGDVQALTFESTSHFSWSPPAEIGGGAIDFDVLRAAGSGMPASVQILESASCIESREPDMVAVDPSIPPPNTIYYYLVRANNPCSEGFGDLGQTSDGFYRESGACP